MWTCRSWSRRGIPATGRRGRDSDRARARGSGRSALTTADTLLIDGNTGTQLDVPPHSVTPADSGLPNAGPFGLAFTDKIAAWQFGGEACVIDCTDLHRRRRRRAEAPW